jgi:hypothetical protein
MTPISANKFAFVELAKHFLGFTHLQGKASGFNPSPGDEIVCFDMVLNFPEHLIDAYLRESGQGAGEKRSLRGLAHGVVNLYYNRPNHVLRDEGYKSIRTFIREWKVQHEQT